MLIDINKTCLVFGNLGEQNKAICIEMATCKYNIAFNYSDAEESIASEFVEQLKVYDVEVLYFNVNINDVSGIEQMVQGIVDSWGGLAVLINTCDTMTIRPFEEISPSDLKNLVDDNLTSIYNITKSALNPMIARKNGKIINLSSSLACKSLGLSTAAYSAVKAGSIGFTKALCKEVGRYGITVNTILAGNIIGQEYLNTIDERGINLIKRRIPCGRFGQVNEVAKAISSLCLGSNYISGQVLAVDGGLTDYTI